MSVVLFLAFVSGVAVGIACVLVGARVVALRLASRPGRPGFVVQGGGRSSDD